MIGILVVTHSNVGQALVECGEQILGRSPGVAAVKIDADDNHDMALARIREAVGQLNAPDGVLVLTDMFGGTPSNVSLTLLEPSKIEVVSGVNMPMLLHAVTARSRTASLAELAKNTAASGRKNIVIAGALLDDAGAAS
jgi:mannose PTS system EIIA component